MTKRTKKVGISGKYSVRYGVTIRKRMAVVETAKSQKYSCPRCLAQRVKRTDTGIWKCRKCDLVFAGGAYVPQITAGITREISGVVKETAKEPEEEKSGAEEEV